MLIPLIVGSLAVILTYLSQHRQNGFGLKMGFFVLFVFLALRYDYGNDYMAYLDGFNEVTANVRIFLTGERWEPGWTFLQFLFKPFGFFAMIGFTSLLTYVVFYRFVRDYVPASYQWLAVFLYAFDPYLLQVPASMMRQNIGVLLFLVGIELIYKKRIILYLLLAAVAASFHKSGIILLPLVLLAFINIKVNKFVASVFLLSYFCLFLFMQTIFPYISRFIGAYFQTYAETYTGGTSFNTGIGFIYSLFLLCSILYYAGVEFNRDEESGSFQEIGDDVDMDSEQFLSMPAPDKHTKFFDLRARRLLFIVAVISFVFTPLGLQLAMFGRINYYFTPVLIAVYPIIVFTTRNKFFKLVFMSSLMAFTLFRFWVFFVMPGWSEKFGTYQTIFSAPQWY